MEPELYRLFVDESYLVGKTGWLQAAVFLPGEWYLHTAVPAASRLLLNLGKGAKEFKGSSITEGNRATYLEFLKLFSGAIAGVGLSGQACSTVTVDGREFHPSEYIDSLTDKIVSAFSDYGVTPSRFLLREFATQLAWLGHHGKYIVRTPITNPIGIVFDTKYSYAQMLREVVTASKPGLGSRSFTIAQLLTVFANTPSIRGMLNALEIRSFDVTWSEAEFGLQAADLLVNLFHASLRYAKGIRSASTVLKHDLLKQVLSNTPDEPLLRALKVIGDELECEQADLTSHCQIIP
jgi:hypothetical protein